jgi:transposase
LARKSDITLKEIRAELAKLGVSAGIVTIWRFFQRHRLTLKKRRRMPPSRTVQTS